MEHDAGPVKEPSGAVLSVQSWVVWFVDTLRFATAGHNIKLPHRHVTMETPS
jgi:hypothetical protein